VAAIICPSYEKLSQEQSDGTYLINELKMVEIVGNKHMEPQLRLATFDEITHLLFKRQVVVGDGDVLVITKALGICDVHQIRVPGLAKLSDNQRLIKLDQVGTSQYRFPPNCDLLTLFSLWNVSRLLLLSI
jgi:hypothetical protein